MLFTAGLRFDQETSSSLRDKDGIRTARPLASILTPTAPSKADKDRCLKEVYWTGIWLGDRRVRTPSHASPRTGYVYTLGAFIQCWSDGWTSRFWAIWIRNTIKEVTMPTRRKS